MTAHYVLPKNVITGRNEVVAKVMFLQVCVCPQGGRVSASVHAGMPDPPGWRTPPDGDPPGMETPLPPGWRTPPPSRETDCNIRSTSGRYASSWNAFLLWLFFLLGGWGLKRNSRIGPKTRLTFCCKTDVFDTKFLTSASCFVSQMSYLLKTNDSPVSQIHVLCNRLSISTDFEWYFIFRITVEVSTST